MKIVIFSALFLLFLSYSIMPTYGYKIWNYFQKGRCNQTIYLTFDDGPDSEYTLQLLNLLDRYNIKASFFVVAEFAKQNSAIIKRMQQAGHLIGLHSLSHKNGLVQTPASTEYDFEQSIEIMKQLGVDIHYFRPPWGHFNISTILESKKRGLQAVLWKVMAQDWKGNTTVTKIQQKLIVRTNGGDIVCLHDGRGSNEAPRRMIEALERVLPFWISKGYKFDTVEHYYE